jgi:hypothetical protein
MANAPADERLKLLEQLAEMIAKAKTMDLPQSVFLLNMAHLDLQTKIHNIGDDEMEAFVNAVSASYQCH